MKTSITFINHASVVVRNAAVSLLTDPWFAGSAFHKGWNLLHETPESEVESLLNGVSHIWISHEHPDHFSIEFFNRYADRLKNLEIQILFQTTRDKRVVNFLRKKGLLFTELKFGNEIELGSDFYITCLKDGFYDSALLIRSCGEKILNLNDCEVKSNARAKEIFTVTGNVDVLLTQFSYAAWKGGRENVRWRRMAAKEKLEVVALQVETFMPQVVIPFASYAYFSNSENFYLNEDVNRPEALRASSAGGASKVIIMAPGHVLGGSKERINQDEAIAFWSRKYENIMPLNNYVPIEMKVLEESFKVYCARLAKNNDMILIRLLRLFPVLGVFRPFVIFLTDLKVTVRVDYVRQVISTTNEAAMLSMKSEALNFIFLNTFGFDTLTVNGCFEEKVRGGFISCARSLAIENLNNIGYSVGFRILFNPSILRLFLARLSAVRRRLAHQLTLQS